MTCPCGQPARPSSTLGMCAACAKERHAARARERVAEFHRQRMIARYGTPTAPEDWRKQARRPSAVQQAGKAAMMPPKFVGTRQHVAPIAATNPGVEITRIPSTMRFEREVRAEEIDPARAAFIDALVPRKLRGD